MLLRFFYRRTVVGSIFGLGLLAAGCAPPQPPVANTNSSPQPAASAIPSLSATPQPQIANAPFTLPILDAMLSDDSFANDATKEIQLTDAELQKLRDISRNAVIQLSDSSPDESRSTKSAAAEAHKKIEDVLGNDRTDRLISLVQKRWGGEDQPLAKPNLVPDDTRIVVNAPAYRMDIFQNGKLIKTYKVGIGYPEFPLPTGLRKATAIIFNPTWTPPDEPWVKGKVEPGKKVEAGDALNPLGPIKIPIGLPSLIHGGKSPGRLGTFASHGCVGLTDPQVQDLAVELSKLSGRPLTRQDIKGYEKAKTETKEVKLADAIPVELRYETIVVENGTLKIYRDVYERGTNTEDDLRRVLESYGLSLDNIQPDIRAKISAALEQMSLSPTGQSPDSEPDNKAKSNSNSGKVTRNIKGQKEVDFKLPELAGKGYPAPVGLKM